VISQLFGGGGNTNAPFRNDFIELFNHSTTPIDLTGWSVQYAGATSSTWSVTPLTPTILAPGQHYMVQQASGANNGIALPQPDATGTIAMAAAAGKVALVKTTTALTGPCPNDPNIIDLVGYGATASCFKGNAPAPAASNTNAVIRKSDGCADTANNSADFIAAPPNPRNLASPVNICTQSAVANIGAEPTGVDFLELIHVFAHGRNHFPSHTLWLRQLPRRPT
jgi:predicted extracellular nuclease